MRDTLRHRSPTGDHDSGTDAGYTLIELIIVTLILGVLVTVVVFAVGGTTTDAAGTGCDADRRQLHVATEAYFAEHGGATLPATGSDHERYERTLVDTGMLRSTSEYFDLGADGTVAPQEGSSC